MTNMTSVGGLSTNSAEMRGCGTKLDADSAEAMAKVVRLYLSPTRPTKTLLYKHYRASVVEENRNRLREGSFPLRTVGESTFHRAIGRLDAAEVAVVRYGRNPVKASAAMHRVLRRKPKKTACRARSRPRLPG